MLPSAPEAVYLVNRHGVIRFATPVAAQLYGYPVNDIIGRTLLRYIAPEAHAEIAAAWLAFARDPAQPYIEFTAPLITANGYRSQVRSSVWRVPGTQTFVLVHHVMDAVRDRLDALYAILAAAAGTLELVQVMDIVLQEAQRLIPSERGKVFIFDDEGRVTLVHTLTEGDRAYTPQALKQFSGFATLRAIFETGQPLIIHDARRDKRWVQRPKRPAVGSWLGVPLVVQGKVIGVLSVQSPNAHAFTHDDAVLAQALASQVAVAIQNARLFRAERERVKRYQVLNDVSQAISFLDLKGVLEVVYEKLRGLMDTTTFYIGLYDAEAGTITFAGSYEGGNRVPDTSIRADQGLAGEVLRTRRSFVLHDTEANPLPVEAIVEGAKPRSLLMLPLIVHDQVVGVISVQSYRPHAYSDEDVSLLETIAGAVATAIHNAHLYDQTVERLAALEALHRNSLYASATDDIDAIAAQVVETVLNLFGPLQARLCLWAEWQDRPAATWLAQTVLTPGHPNIRQEADFNPCSLLQQVRATGEPVMIPNLDDQPALQEEISKEWLVKAVIAMPLKRGDRQIGAVSLLYAEAQLFRRETLRTLELLCMQAAGSLDRAQQTIALRRRLQEANALQELARVVSSLEDLDTLMTTAVQMLHDIYHCRSVSLALLDETGQQVITRAAVGLEERFLAEARFALGEPVAGLVVARGEPIYVPDAALNGDFRVIDPEIRCLMSVPLTVQNRTIGALSIDSDQPHAFTPDHQRVLTIAGGQIAAAIETVRLLAETRRHAEELARANAELQTIDEVRKDLVNQLSHDLRSPLSIVYGYAGLLRDGEVGEITEEQRVVLDLILQRTRAITHMTTDILSTRQSSRDMLDLEPLDLEQMCQQTLADARMAYRDQGVTFEGDFAPGPLIIEGDSNRLHRVFDNLIGNAVKFSPDGGHITLKVERHDSAGEVWVSVRDEGIGIPSDKLPYVFERFFQGDIAIKKRFGGSGLGLYIVKLIVEAHLGRVWAESCEGAGSTFTFALPLMQAGDDASGEG